MTGLTRCAPKSQINGNSLLTDTQSGFDHRAFFMSLPRPLLALILAAEACLVPAVELFFHARTALGTLLDTAAPLRRKGICLAGTSAVVLFHAWLAQTGGAEALFGYSLSTILLLHVLSLHDAFQHTYEVLDNTCTTYKPGPGPRHVLRVSPRCVASFCVLVCCLLEHYLQLGPY